MSRLEDAVREFRDGNGTMWLVHRATGRLRWMFADQAGALPAAERAEYIERITLGAAIEASDAIRERNAGRN